MSLYSDLAIVADDLLNEFNQGTLQIIRMVQGSGPGYDPGDAIETITAVKGVTRGVEKKFIDGVKVFESDLQATLPPTEINPGDFIRIDGTDYKIISVQNVPASGEKIVTKIIFR